MNSSDLFLLASPRPGARPSHSSISPAWHAAPAAACRQAAGLLQLAVLLLAILLWPVLVQAEIAAGVHFVSGAVNGQLPGQAPRELAKGDDIFNRDRIETAANGRIQMRFTDGGLVSLMPNTSFSVEEYRLDGNADDEGSLVFSMVRGGLRTVTGSIGRTKHENYQLRTPVGTLGIRGTEYIAVLEPPTVLHVHVGVGRVILGNEYGSLEVPAGRSARMELGSAPVFTDEAPRFLADAPINRDTWPDRGLGIVDQDPYFVTVSYDLPMAGAKQLAEAGNQLPPAPIPPQPEPGPAEPEPIPEPGPTPPTPGPVIPEPPVGASYQGWYEGGTFSTLNDVVFDTDGKLVSVGETTIDVADFSAVLNSDGGVDVAIGFSEPGTAASDYYVLSASNGVSLPNDWAMSYSLPPGGMQVGRFSDGEAQLEEFTLLLSPTGGGAEYDLQMEVTNSNSPTLSYRVEDEGNLSALQDGFHIGAFSSTASVFTKSGGSCIDCSLLVDGVFGQNIENLGVRYVLEEASTPVAHGAAILDGEMLPLPLPLPHGMAVAYFDDSVTNPTMKLAADDGMANFDLVAGGQHGNVELIFHEILNDHLENQTSTIANHWAEAVVVGMRNGFLPFTAGAFKTPPLLPDLPGRLMYRLPASPSSIVSLEKVGNDFVTGSAAGTLERFDLDLYSHGSGSTNFDLDMEFQAAGSGPLYRAAKVDGQLVYGDYGFSLGFQGGDSQALILQDNLNCANCRLEAAGVFSGSTDHMGVVYDLQSGTSGDVLAIRGAAILGQAESGAVQVASPTQGVWISATGQPEAYPYSSGTTVLNRDGLLMSLDDDLQSQGTPLDWASMGIVLATDTDHSLYAFGAPMLDVPLAGSLKFSLSQGPWMASGGESGTPELQQFDLTLNDLDATQTFDLKVGILDHVLYVAEKEGGTLTYSPGSPSVFSLAVDADDMTKSGDVCAECVFNAAGVFDRSAENAGIVYQLNDPAFGPLDPIRGRAILKRDGSDGI